jgi:hypothetical protein
MPNLPPFHFAFPITPLTQATTFLLGSSGHALGFKRAQLFAR